MRSKANCDICIHTIHRLCPEMVDQPVHQNKKTGLGWLSHVVPNSAPSKLDSSRPEMLAPYMLVKIIEQIWHICNTRVKRKHLMYKFWHKVCKTYKYIQYVASICYFQSFCKLPLHPKQSHALSCSPCGTCGKDGLSAMLIAQCSSSFPRVASWTSIFFLESARKCSANPWDLHCIHHWICSYKLQDFDLHYSIRCFFGNRYHVLRSPSTHTFNWTNISGLPLVPGQAGGGSFKEKKL